LQRYIAIYRGDGGPLVRRGIRRKELAGCWPRRVGQTVFHVKQWHCRVVRVLRCFT